MFCCSRYRPSEPEYAPLFYRNRFIRRKWNSVSLRVGLLSPKRKRKFLPKVPKSPRFAYQIRRAVASYKKWHDEFVMSIVGVQPMTAPMGKIFTLRYTWYYENHLSRWEDDG